MRLLQLFTGLLFLLVPFTFTHADQLEDVLKSGEIKIAVPENFPPFGSVGKSLEHEGYDVDVAKLIAENLGVEVEIVPVTPKQRIPFLSSGKVVPGYLFDGCQSGTS